MLVIVVVFTAKHSSRRLIRLQNFIFSAHYIIDIRESEKRRLSSSSKKRSIAFIGSVTAANCWGVHLFPK